MKYDVIIIGGGPAGLTAAVYARRSGKSVLLLEAKSCGGQIINTPDIENYPVEMHISGYDFATRLTEQARALGAEIVLEKATDLRLNGSEKTVTTAKNAYEGRSVIIATGSAARKLGLENEDALVGRGVSYCATCDGNFFRKKKVAVVGGGNTALEDALYLADLADTVYLIHRRDAFRGEDATLARLKARENVRIIYNSTVTALRADKRLRSIEVTNKDGSVAELEINGLFVAVGRIPENRNFAAAVDLDEAGYAVAGENCRTRTPGVFVAGDNRTKDVRQLVTAAADGAVAATEAVKYLNETR
ncbi:MAG: FAD-dependent oxidoreductase [Clostridia bacterium]|nr:FAD-dependent oxidoreductase [Clostridia bacterium]MBQ9506070.1 FAD-dependent oxidoreductase [Clostridia bacterium]